MGYVFRNKALILSPELKKKGNKRKKEKKQKKIKKERCLRKGVT